MRICLVCNSLWLCTYGGAERRYRELAYKFVRRGYDVVYLRFRPIEKPKSVAYD